MLQEPTWIPSKQTIANSNIYKMMQKHRFTSYVDFWNWSVREKALFWSETVENLDIHFSKKFTKIVDVSNGVETAKWMFGARMNIVDSCFQNEDDAIVLKFKTDSGVIQNVSQKKLASLVNNVANSFNGIDIVAGDTIAIDMPMTMEAVSIYLGAIKAGIKVATIADSFTSNEITVRLKITEVTVVFTQDRISRMGKYLPLYDKVVEAGAKKIVVISTQDDLISLRHGDVLWNNFLSSNEDFESVKQDPQETITILFSSGTTGEPKAIPWNHTTPIKGASDGHYHHDIHRNDVVCWPTSLGWMMGPWLVFSTLINKACIALYYDAPLTKGFGEFVENVGVTMLGVVPSIVKYWKNTSCMESLDWSSIKCFSSTGEVSNPAEMVYLMNLAGNKPVIEYCGGTEIGGGYVASTLVQPNIAATFSTQTLGGEFVLLDEDGKKSAKGELFLIPPIMGLSTTLLYGDHLEVYYKNTPEYSTKLRRHGDELIHLEKGYYRMLGRIDDAMNLGGIKVSATQIEMVVNKLSFVQESAAVAVSPKNGGPSKLVIFYVGMQNELDDSERLQCVKKQVIKMLNPLFKVSELVKINTLPRTASNKIMRRKLRESQK